MTRSLPSVVRAELKEVHGFISGGRHEEAHSLLAALRTRCPAEPQILLEVGAAHLAMGAYTDARQFFRAAMIKAEPASSVWGKATKRLATEAARENAFPQAIALMEAYLEAQPSDGPNADKLLHWKIRSHAEQDWPRVLREHAERFAVSEAHALFRALMIEPVTDWASLLVDRAPDFVRQPDTTVLAVDLRIARGGFDEALQLAIVLFRAKRPGSRELNCLMRACRARNLPDDKVVQLYDEYLILHPLDTKALTGRARRLMKLRRLVEVVEIAKRVLELDPGNWDAAELAAKALAKQDRPAEANAYCDRLFESLAHRADQYLLRMVNLELDLGRIQSATKRVELAEQSGRPIPNLAEAQIAVKLAAGRYREAWPLIERSVATSDDVELRELAVRCGTAISVASDDENQFPDALYKRVFARPAARAGLHVRPDAPIIYVTSTLTAGGAERQIALTAALVSKALAARNIPVHLVGKDLRVEQGNAVMLPLLTDSAVRVTDLSLRNAAMSIRTLRARNAISSEDMRVISAFPAQLARSIVLLYEYFIEAAPAVVHLWQDGIISVGSVAAVLAGVPRIVASVRNVAPPETDTRRYRPYLATMYGALGERRDVVLTANSDAGARDYEQQLRLPANSIATIHNGVDVEAIRTRSEVGAVRQGLGHGDDVLVVGGVFRLVPAKNPFRWLDVAAALSKRIANVRFVIVGEGSLGEVLLRYCEELGIAGQVTFAGRQSPVEPWIRAMDLLLLASEVEGLPNVLLEAQSLGVPVVTTNAGGSAEAIKDGTTGLLVMEGTVEALAGACQTILQSAEFRARARSEGPDFVRRTFGVDTMVAKTLDAYFPTAIARAAE